jgi:hypothetical protein
MAEAKLKDGDKVEVVAVSKSDPLYGQREEMVGLKGTLDYVQKNSGGKTYKGAITLEDTSRINFTHLELKKAK